MSLLKWEIVFRFVSNFVHPKIFGFFCISLSTNIEYYETLSLVTGFAGNFPKIFHLCTNPPNSKWYLIHGIWQLLKQEKNCIFKKLRFIK